MPQVIQLPTVAETSLGNLGGVLLGAATDYAQNTRADRLRGEQRQQRLSDVADERQYQERRHATLRSEHIDDLNAEQQRALKRELLRLGLISAELLDAPLSHPGVIAGFAEMQKLGLLDRYKDAFKLGFLTLEDLGNEAAMKGGLAKYSAHLKAETDFQTNKRTQGTALANRTATEQQQLSGQLDDINASLSAEPPEPSPSEVRMVAIGLAMAATKKPQAKLSESDIAQQAEAARAELKARIDSEWAKNYRTAQVQAENTARRYTAVSGRGNALASQGYFGVPTETPAPTPQAALTQPTMDRASVAKSVAATVAEEMRKRREAAQPTPPPTAAAAPGGPATPQTQSGWAWQTFQADPFNEKANQLAEVRRKKAEILQRPLATRPFFMEGDAGPDAVPTRTAAEVNQLELLELQLVKELEAMKPKTFFKGTTPSPVSAAQPGSLYDPSDYRP